MIIVSSMAKLMPAQATPNSLPIVVAGKSEAAAPCQEAGGHVRTILDASRALRYYRHGVSLEPTGFHYNQLGVLLRTRDRHDEAVRCFRAASSLLPSDANASFHLALSRSSPCTPIHRVTLIE